MGSRYDREITWTCQATKEWHSHKNQKQKKSTSCKSRFKARGEHIWARSPRVLEQPNVGRMFLMSMGRIKQIVPCSDKLPGKRYDLGKCSGKKYVAIPQMCSPFLVAALCAEIRCSSNKRLSVPNWTQLLPSVPWTKNAVIHRKKQYGYRSKLVLRTPPHLKTGWTLHSCYPPTANFIVLCDDQYMWTICEMKSSTEFGIRQGAHDWLNFRPASVFFLGAFHLLVSVSSKPRCVAQAVTHELGSTEFFIPHCAD